MTQHALVTGGAGFIGSHLVDRLLNEGWRVTVLDNFDEFYDAGLKRRNVAPHLACPAYELIEADLRDVDALKAHLTGDYDVVVHLAARAGVRPSIEAPLLYQDVNVRGTQNLLEVCRARGIRQFVFASSSSVYGVNPNVPWSEEDHVLMPISPYASTKVSGELLGHVYSHLFGIRFIALRFFTVYGPRQRPDLAINRFARLLLDGKSIPVFGDGTTRRDYTFVADIVAGIVAAMTYDKTSFEVINLGNNSPIGLLDLIETIADAVGAPARLDWLPMQLGDVPQTWAAVDKANRLLGYEPATSMQAGLETFVRWLQMPDGGAATPRVSPEIAQYPIPATPVRATSSAAAAR